MSVNSAPNQNDDVTFDVLPLSPEVRSAVDELGYVRPTPVQRAVFEPAARGQDLVVQARTGTGKTAAFGLPLVDRLVRRKTSAVQALALCPTRELALQVTRELGALSKHNGISVLPVYGGAPMPKQIEGLKAGAQIVVGTPGRVFDHLRRKTLDPSSIRALVLDECDEMLSMGFLPQILEIWNELPKSIQVLLFSATVARPVLRIADTRLKNPEFITLSGDQVGALEIQHYVYISRGDKIQELLRILQAEDPDSAIIFCNTRDDTQRLALELQRAGYAADWLNADLSQKEREAVMAATRERRLRFLVCTDVAARGIDISHLTHVINFDFPEATEQYVHRTGRTGRAGRMGTAISLVSPSSIGNLYYLRLEYKIHPTERQLPTEQELRTRAETETLLGLAEQLPKPTEAQLSLARRLLSHEQSEVIIAGLLQERLGEAAAAGTLPKRSPEARQRARENLVPTPPSQRERPRASRSMTEEPPAPVDTRARHRAETLSRRRSRPQSGQERPARSATYLEEGFSYEVRDVSAADLAALEGGSSGEEAATEAPPRRERSRRGAPPSTSARVAPENEAEERSIEDDAASPTEEIFINVGKDDGVSADDVKNELVAAGISAEDTAYVRVRQRHTFVGVRQGLLDKALAALNGRQIASRAVEAEPARPRQQRPLRRAQEG